MGRRSAFSFSFSFFANTVLVIDVVFDDIVVDDDVAKVSVVGIGMRSHAGVAQRMFKALASESINIKVITTSEIKVSVLVDSKYLELAVQALHDEFELDIA